MVTLNLNDLAHILEQIRIAEDHSAAITAGQDPRQALADLVTNPLIPDGLRTVSGQFNNFQVDLVNSGSADQLLQRLLTPVFNDAEVSPDRVIRTPDPANPGQFITTIIPGRATSYTQTTGSVYDSQPRTISNLVADQTLGNIAAISAALTIARVTGVENITKSKLIYDAYKAAQEEAAQTQGLSLATLQANLATQQGQLTAAITDRDVKAGLLTGAETALTAAQTAEAAAQAAFDALMGGVTAAQADVDTAQTALTAAMDAAVLAANAVLAATSALSTADADVLAKQGLLATAQTELTNAQAAAVTTEATKVAEAADLAAAQTVLDLALAALAAADLTPGSLDDTNAAIDVAIATQARELAQDAYDAAVLADTAADAVVADKQAAVATAQTSLSDAISVQTTAFGTLSSVQSAQVVADSAVVTAQEALTAAEAVLTAANDAVTADAGATAAALAAAEAILATAVTAEADAQAAYDAAVQTVTTETADVTAAQNAFLPFNEAAAANAAVQALVASNGIEMDGVNVLLGNVAADLGDTAPYNSFFTIFGQFFDHGLDLTNKGGSGTVFIPLQPDDPLYVPGSPTNFMVLTRATNQAGGDNILGTADDIRQNANETTPWIDLNQVYTSNPSHQVFLREYALVDGKPVATGHMLESATGGPPTWADIKEQAASKLGIVLSDMNVHSVPAVLTDLYGRFVADANGMPQFIQRDGTVLSGALDGSVTSANSAGAGRAFLNDIAHGAVPGFVDPDRDPSTPMIEKAADADTITGNAQAVNGLGVSTTYDNEMLDRHFIVGDGRGNENIALTAVHTIFHGEHNRQIEDVKTTLLGSTDLALLQEFTAGVQTQQQLQTYLDTYATLSLAATTPAGEAALADFVKTVPWDGERLFQTARFSTEMVYQHLVFEEFVRSIAPQIDPFVFSNTIEIPVGISQEFAQVVYRFGHSMLNETVDMLGMLSATGALGETSTVGLTTVDLFDAFLNPVAFDAQGVDAHAAAGAILRGMTRQHGNEIDEFLTDALRNNLVGLPLDLGALNIARARDTGIPSLNEARRQFFEQTQDTYLKPYESWTDFAANIKNPMSIVNFIAAYGQHETILLATDMDAKRDAAMKLVFGGAGTPTDRLDFVNSTGAWATKETGLNTVDFWIGGLAEAKMPFGGMLGSTFTFVFEVQMEQLQNNDRFYYLSRTQGMNLLTQLESDSFADLIQRNTDGEHLGLSINGAAFQTAAWVLEMDQAKQFNVGLGNADPTREMDVLSSLNGSASLVERDGNMIKFLGGEHVVIGGTAGRDIIISGAGDDGLWGYGGDDDIEGGYGVDHIHGGEGSDLITDSGVDIGAADVLKGEGGDDLINAGMGLDLVFGGSGRDVIAGGSEAKDIFGGQGDDFIRSPSGGGGIVYGNEGNDWMEGQGNMNTLTGDNSELFFNSRIIGHDVMTAGENDTDFDAESGDDIMVQGIGINRNNGMAGFDWVSYKGNDYAVDADMNISLFVNQQNNILRDRFDLVEGLSGWDNNDKLTGREVVVGAYDDAFNAAQVSATAPIASYSNALLEENVDMVDGLRDLVDHLATFTLSQPNTGEVKVARMSTVNGDDILLGGGGSDIIKGMAGDDIIDGDKWLNVRIEVKVGGVVVGTTDGLTKQVFDLTTGAVMFGGKSLEQALFAREVKAADLDVVREILDGDAANTGVDTAVYWDVRANYTVTRNADGSVTVTHNNELPGPVDPTSGRALRNEGSDRLTNIEILRFGDGDVIVGNIAPTGAPTVSDTSPTEGQLISANTSLIVDPNGLAGAVMAYQWQSSADSGATWVNIAGATTQNLTPLQAQTGQLLRVQVSYTDAMGYAETVFSAPTEVVGDLINGTPAIDTITGTNGADILNGNGGNDVITANAGADTITGGTGGDAINAGAGDDLITWSVGDGVDTINGGTEVTIGDTLIINGNAFAETYRVYAVSNWLGLGRTAPAGTEIVITRNGTNQASAITFLQEIEEIVINTGLGVGFPNPFIDSDQVLIIGDFTPTNLNFNTITINGSAADDTVDISALESAHRILFRSNGGNDTVVGTLRAQDVIEIAEGADPAAYEAVENENGTITMSDGTHSVTFTGSMAALPTLSPKGTHQPGEGEGAGTGADDNSVGGGSEGEGESSGGEGNDDPADDESESPDEDNSGAGSGTGTGAGNGTGPGTGAGTGTGTVDTDTDGVIVMPGSGAGVQVGGANDDVLVGGDAGDALIGKAGADIILGNGGNDVATGGSGADIIEGGAGRDVQLGGAGDDIFIVQNGDGSDMIFGGAGSDTLDLSAVTGGAVIDLGAYTPIGTVKSGGVTDHLMGVENVIGSEGADTIKAGLAINVMTGGDGEDIFVFVSAGTANGDVITDFRPGDKIDLSGIDAMFGTAGNQSFTLADQGSTAAGSLVIREVNGANGVDTIIDGFTDDDADADFSITLRGGHTLTDSSFNF